MTHVYVLAAGNERGGAASHLLTLAKIHRQSGRWPLTFLLVGDGYLANRLEGLGVTIEMLPKSPRLAITQASRRLMGQSDVLLHAHGPRMNLLGYWIARRCRIAFTTTLHSHVDRDFLSSRWKTLLFPKLNRWCLRRTTGIFAVNQTFAMFAPDKPFVWVPNAIDMPVDDMSRERARAKLLAQTGWPKDAMIVGVAARFDAVKDLPTLIRGIHACLDVPVYLAIAGDGKEAATLQALVVSLGLSSRVAFLGFLSDVRGFYAALDVHVLCSLSEGTPTSVLEAGAAGAVNVGTQISGITPLIHDHQTGLTFPVGQPQALAACLRYLDGHPEEAQTFVTRFRTDILPVYSPQHMLDAYEAGYQSFLGLDSPGLDREEANV